MVISERKKKSRHRRVTVGVYATERKRISSVFVWGEEIGVGLSVRKGKNLVEENGHPGGGEMVSPGGTKVVNPGKKAPASLSAYSGREKKKGKENNCRS